MHYLGQKCGKEEGWIMWDDRCQWCFDDLKHLCTTVPILAYADFKRPLKLYTDSCGSSLGAVLYQTHDDGTDAVIAYASRSLKKAECHYPAHKLEFLTLKWAVIKKFQDWLSCLPKQQPPDLCLDNGQTGCCQSLLGDQLGQLQFSAVLSGREDDY